MPCIKTAFRESENVPEMCRLLWEQRMAGNLCLMYFNSGKYGKRFLIL